MPCSSDHGTCPESDRRIPILDELQARVDREAALEREARPDPGSSSTFHPPSTTRSGRGGRRPGAGAPKGNLNALKHGLRSKQFAAVGRLLAQDPKIREALLNMAGRYDLKRARATEMASLLLTMMFERAQQLSGGRLNEPAATDDWRSIKAAARFLSSGRHGADQKFSQSRRTINPRTRPPPINQTAQPRRPAGHEHKRRGEAPASPL